MGGVKKVTYKEQALTFLGITRWHEAGYTGKGIKIMSDEKVCKKSNKDVISPAGFKSKKGHGDSVMAHIKLVAPEAEFIAYPFSGAFTSDSYKCECADYIIKNNVLVFTTSCLGGSINKGKEKAMQVCIDHGCIFFASAGNKGSIEPGEETAIHGEASSDKYLAIGGVKPTFLNRYNGDDPLYDWGKLKKVRYSSEGEELDYVTIAEISGASGTSFCSPIFAGMVALVQQFFIEKVNRPLTEKEMICFIEDNLIDLDDEGFDIRTGHGLFILPDPDDIPILEYVTDIDVGSIDYGGFPQIGDDIEMRGIDKLHPELQVCVNKFLEECKKQGLNVLVTETLRTQEEQERLYAKGRTQPGKIVTNCRGYQSPHCWGVAFDFCRNVKGREYDNTDGFFEKVGSIAKELFKDTEYRLFWGGDFKTFVDKPHIEMVKYMPNNSTKWLVNTYGTPEKFKETWSKGDEDNMDEKVSSWAETAWNWCKEKGYLDGSNPKGTVTREMLAQVLYNLFAKGGDK